MNKLVPMLAAAFIRTLHSTLRVRHVRSAAIERLNAEGKHYIVTFWHGHLLMMLYSKFSRPISVISSRSRDGEIIARVFDYYGVKSARGSSSRGGGAALRELIRFARSGSNIVFTPDGPKGPPRVLKDGVIYAARATGLPILPIAFAASRRRLLASWDRMTVPKPFSRAIFLYGEPIFIPRDAVEQDWRPVIEERLNALADEAESHCDELWLSAKP